MRSVSRLEPLTNLDQYRFFLVSSVPKKRRVSHDPASSFLSHLLISSILRERGTWCDDRWVGRSSGTGREWQSQPANRLGPSLP